MILLHVPYFVYCYIVGHMVRHVKMGSVIKRCVHQIPHLELDATIQPITRTVLRVRLAITADFHWDDKVSFSIRTFISLIQYNL